jgi:hypothetical protein
MTTDEPTFPTRGRLGRGIEALLRVGGFTLALVQGAWLPLTGRAGEVSVPVLTLAGLMMGVAQAVRVDRARSSAGGGGR